MTVLYDNTFLRDEWIDRNACKEFVMNETGKHAHFIIFGAISVEDDTFYPPFECENGTKWCIFNVSKTSDMRYRLVVYAVDDDGYEKIFNTMDGAIEFLDQFKERDMTYADFDTMTFW